MEQQVVQAIQDKYNLSNAEAQKVVQTLVQVEQKRQAETGAGGSPAGMRGMSRGVGSDIMGLLGGVLSSGGQQQGNQPGITDDIMGMVGGLLGGSGQQGGQGGMNMGNLVGSLLGGNHNMGSAGNLLGVVLDLLSDGGQQNHANSLENIVGGLLGGDAAQGNMDVGGLVGSLLGGGGQSSHQSYQQPAPPVQHQQPSQPNKPDMGSMQSQFGNLMAGKKKKE